MSHPAVRDGAHPLAGAQGVREPLWRVAGLPALAVTVALLATANRYELHGDELYFRMLPPAWWYDDQPPLTVWLSHLGAALGHDPWLQRLPAIAAVACSVLLAACFPRLLLGDDPAARVAAWAHAFTVYPLLMGHVFLTSSLDLVAWQAVVLLTLIALRDHERGLRPRALVWAGVVAGLACWNKLLVVVLLAALAVAVLAADAAVLRTREALSAAVAFVALSAPQLGAQLLHGLPMSRVSGRLIAEHGALNRLLILPLLVAFLGPPMVGVWWRGLRWRRSGTVRTTGASATSAASRARRSRPPVLAVTTAAIVAWNLALPAQPYYAVAAVLPALALGWGAAHRAGAPSWQLRRRIVAGNAAVPSCSASPCCRSGRRRTTRSRRPCRWRGIRWGGARQSTGSPRRGVGATSRSSPTTTRWRGPWPTTDRPSGSTARRSPRATTLSGRSAPRRPTMSSWLGRSPRPIDTSSAPVRTPGAWH